jgi:hypothetical protein
MDKVATFTGFAATTLWLSLAILTAGSAHWIETRSGSIWWSPSSFLLSHS